MRPITLLIALSLSLGLTAGCKKRPEATPSEATEPQAETQPKTQNDVTPNPKESVTPKADSNQTEKTAKPVLAPKPVEPTAEDLAARAEADEARKKRAAKVFTKVIVPLTEASEAYQEHDSLDRSSWFGKDQGDNQERINELLNEAIKALEVAEIEDIRQRIRDLEKANEEATQSMVDDRESRLAAPTKEELNRLQKTYTMSREEYDERIVKNLRLVETNKQKILEMQTDFVRQMRGIGVELDLESAQSLLSTVTGDDFVQMCVVFDNVRGVTVQLQELTEQSGESLEAAKRYYGSYVVLIRLLDHVQKDFIRRARQEMIPQLAIYKEKAVELIGEAQDNLANGGDQAIGAQNIRSNELTIHATELYTEYLHEQANEIEARNAQLQIALRDAENTFDTVSLSSEVASLLREGSRNFGALLRLDLPALRGFENSELKAEFERLTEKMTRIN